MGLATWITPCPQRVWEAFSIKDMGEYHDLYLKTHTLLLFNIFESFRDLCLEIYHLDPAHFYTALGLALQAALKLMGVELELLTDMHLIFERGVQGGMVQVAHHLAEANNKYMGRRFNSHKPSSKQLIRMGNVLFTNF